MNPPDSPENAIVAPSGDQAGLVTSSTASMVISRSFLPRSTSTIVSTECPPAMPGNANFLLVRSHDPADEMNCRLSLCALVAVSVTLRSTSPVFASAT